MSGGARRILVTGAGGFIGQHLVRALSGAGHEVIALVRAPEVPPALLEAKATVLRFDLGNDELPETLPDVECICHLAAKVPPGSRASCPADASYETNAFTTLGLAGAAVARGVPRFVLASTANSYAWLGRDALEEDALLPTGRSAAYFASKATAENHLLRVTNGTQTRPAVLRIGSAYGLGEPEEKVVSRFLRAALARRPLVVAGDGSARHNFVHVADVTRAFVAAIEREVEGIFNVAAGEHPSLLELAQAIVRCAGASERSIVLEGGAADSFPGFAPVSIERARSLLGLKPLPLDAGLARYRDELLARTR